MVWEREKWFLSSMDLLVTDKESQFQNAISICKLRYDARKQGVTSNRNLRMETGCPVGRQYRRNSVERRSTMHTHNYRHIMDNELLLSQHFPKAMISVMFPRLIIRSIDNALCIIRTALEIRRLLYWC